MRINTINKFTKKSILRYLFGATIIASAFFYSISGNSQTNDAFLVKLFSPVELIKRGIIIPQQYSQLTELDKQNLNKAKEVLVGFLKSFKKREQDPLEYLHPSLRKKYKDRVMLYQQEFGAEALLKIKIFNFLVKGQVKDEIIFYAALTDTTEGEDRTLRTAYALKKSEGTWKISRFGRDIKYWRVELRL